VGYVQKTIGERMGIDMLPTGLLKGKISGIANALRSGIER
jgi:hypothetical protein